MEWHPREELRHALPAGQGRRVGRHSAWLSAAWIALLLVVLLAQAWQAPAPRPTDSVWGRRPVLAYLALTTAPMADLRSSGILDETQFHHVQEVARREQQRLDRLEQASEYIVGRQDLSLFQKRLLIKMTRYNAEVFQVIRDSLPVLQARLGLPAYYRLAAWAEQRWRTERAMYGAAARQSGPRTYRIFATHYDSKGSPVVALPDACLKLANGGSRSCDDKGYQTGQSYTVFIGYQGKTAAALVGEAGPWNVDDNYWASLYDPQPRRMFADLALGLPEAQAAFFNGYNGGVDQYGRTVTAPFGIDLGDGVGSQVGLQPGMNDWIEVTFMWTEGWGQPVAGASSGGAVAPLQTATPAEDGSVVHEVQEGQALWSIAAAYQVGLANLLALNGLTEQSVIRPGDRLVIRPGSPTTVASSTPTRLMPSRTPLAPRQATNTSQPVARQTNTPSPSIAATPGGQSPDPLLVIILVVVSIGLVLVLAGMRRR